MWNFWKTLHVKQSVWQRKPYSCKWRDHCVNLLAGLLPQMQPTNAKIQEQPNRKKRKFESPPDEATWWSTLGKQSKEEALREFREHGESRKLTMTAKNFASRVYKQPQFTSVDMRRAAHRDAREYIESLAKPETS